MSFSDLAIWKQQKYKNNIWPFLFLYNHLEALYTICSSNLLHCSEKQNFFMLLYCIPWYFAQQNMKGVLEAWFINQASNWRSGTWISGFGVLICDRVTYSTGSTGWRDYGSQRQSRSRQEYLTLYFPTKPSYHISPNKYACLNKWTPDFWFWLAISQKLLNRSVSRLQHLKARFSSVGPASFIEIRQG